MTTEKIFNILKKFSTPIVILLIIGGLVAYYNIFLIDRTLEELKFSLGQSGAAYDIEDIDGLDIILAKAISNEITPYTLISQNVINLEFAKNIVTEGKNYQQIDYLKVALGSVIKEKENRRGVILGILDDLNIILKRVVAYLTHLPQLLQKKKAKPLPQEGIDLFAKAKELELSNKLQEAVQAYGDFIKTYPDYEKIALVKLRLAYTCHRMGELDRAASVYREIMRFYFMKRESVIAQALLFQLNQRARLIAKMGALLTKTVEISDKDIKTKQDIYYELGVINAQLLNFEEAQKFFKRASNAMPESDLALKSTFNAAWTKKQTGALEESALDINKIMKENPDNILAMDFSYQIADVYHKEGRYKEAIDIYLRLAEEHKGTLLAAQCLFQAGASYMYDLNDDEKAREIFVSVTGGYAHTPYARYLAPDNPTAIFITYLVPRATRIVAWRAGGLLALTGCGGQLAKFRVTIDEGGLNQALNAWLKQELPDTVGNLYVDIKGTEIHFEKNKVVGEGRVTMGKFNIKGRAEGYAKLNEDGAVNAVITKALLDRIPLPPALLNHTLTGISLIANRYFPIIVTEIAINKDGISAEGYGSKRMLSRLKRSAREFTGIEKEIEDIKDPKEGKRLYALFKEKFPESDFTPDPKDDPEAMFQDFFTRMHFYIAFKLLETTKDSKLDYERSIRTLGRLFVKKEKFKVTYKESDINVSLNRLISIEFPWLVNEEFIFDIKGLKIRFLDGGDIGFTAAVGVGKIDPAISVKDLNELYVEGVANLVIDAASGIPRFVFKKISLNGKPFPPDKVNLVTLRCLNLLRDGSLPMQIEKIDVYREGITIKGTGARDLTARIFSDPHLFVIFQIRECDLWAAGIQRLKERPAIIGDYWRGDAFGFEKEVAKTGGQAGVAYEEYRE